jgi:ADP-dependent NAD(P)H-hydrate dehydratase / NAD(P)H-hydrate epimerase
MAQSSVVCGCGGGSSIAAVLPEVLGRAHRLVLDADALNAIAQDSQLQTLLRHRQGRGWITVMTPHPLEAARLLGSSTAQVMGDRLRAARELSDNFAVLCVLKGSGSVICAPESVPRINPTGNAALATAGSGDVLAGMIGSALAQPGMAHEAVLQRVADAVFQHGWLADRWASGAWPAGYIQQTLTANQLARSVRPPI